MSCNCWLDFQSFGHIRFNLRFFVCLKIIFINFLWLTLGPWIVHLTGNNSRFFHCCFCSFSLWFKNKWLCTVNSWLYGWMLSSYKSFYNFLSWLFLIAILSNSLFILIVGRYLFWLSFGTENISGRFFRLFFAIF